MPRKKNCGHSLYDIFPSKVPQTRGTYLYTNKMWDPPDPAQIFSNGKATCHALLEKKNGSVALVRIKPHRAK